MARELLRGETCGVEQRRLREPAGIAVHDVRKDIQPTAAWNPITTEVRFFLAATRDQHPVGRVETQGLMNHHFGEGKFGRLGGYLLALRNCKGEFLTQPCLGVLVLGHERQRAQCIAAVVASKLALIMLIVSSRIRRSSRA